jgi:Response regulators consisting of a CheY-like receiver domain and a winged-helix DNA-binding domain
MSRSIALHACPFGPLHPDVVLVEGDIEVNGMIEVALASSGYNVQVYHSGPDALEALHLSLPVIAKVSVWLRRPARKE